MEVPRAHTIVSFNSVSPLVLAQKNDIQVVALKSIPFFTEETSDT